MNTEKKVLITGGLVTLGLLVGAIFLFTRSENLNVPEDQIVAKQGLHWHPKITVMINGEKQELPANLGMGTVHGKIHTHAQDNKEGVIHMEMQGVVTKEDTKLAHLFQVWGKDFSSTKLFDKTTVPEASVKMTVNGQENTEFENYLMRDGDTIEVKYE